MPYSRGVAEELLTALGSRCADLNEVVRKLDFTTRRELLDEIGAVVIRERDEARREGEDARDEFYKNARREG